MRQALPPFDGLSRAGTPKRNSITDALSLLLSIAGNASGATNPLSSKRRAKKGSARGQNSRRALVVTNPCRAEVGIDFSVEHRVQTDRLLLHRFLYDFVLVRYSSQLLILSVTSGQGGGRREKKKRSRRTGCVFHDDGRGCTARPTNSFSTGATCFLVAFVLPCCHTCHRSYPVSSLAPTASSPARVVVSPPRSIPP